MRVLGIDPGYDRCGVAVAERDNQKKDVLLFSMCVTPPKGKNSERLGYLVRELEKTMLEWSPEVVAIEKVFFSKNKKTALSVAESRGAILSSANNSDLKTHEYSPQEIKLAITGYGASTKKQVADMIVRLVSVRNGVVHDDEFDAIAVALTHLASINAYIEP